MAMHLMRPIKAVASRLVAPGSGLPRRRTRPRRHNLRGSRQRLRPPGAVNDVRTGQLGGARLPHRPRRRRRRHPLPRRPRRRDPAPMTTEAASSGAAESRAAMSGAAMSGAPSNAPARLAPSRLNPGTPRLTCRSPGAPCPGALRPTAPQPGTLRLGVLRLRAAAPRRKCTPTHRYSLIMPIRTVGGSGG